MINFPSSDTCFPLSCSDEIIILISLRVEGSLQMDSAEHPVAFNASPLRAWTTFWLLHEDGPKNAFTGGRIEHNKCNCPTRNVGSLYIGDQCRIAKMQTHWSVRSFRTINSLKKCIFTLKSLPCAICSVIT